MRSTVDEHEVPSAADPVVGGDVAEAVFLGQHAVVPASGPGRIAARLTAPLRDRRALAIKHDQDLLELPASLEGAARAQHHGTASKGSGT
ncbi:MAG TPA: hypothetical protein VH969_11900 [Actinophytocola sp.]|jgi:ABC-type taurine transport system ATPase subunit|uniref:hypothetical protein n=1 Tax=Actinophytocola sp. TaxID=1872138 RepID=UPI002F941BC8